MKSPIEVEREFDAFFDSLGFRRVSEIVGDSPDFPNADYINETDKIVVELKVLDKDYFVDGGFIDRFRGFVPAPVNVNADGTGQYKVTLPPKNREGKYDTFEEPLRRVLKKANKQIKETKKHLLSENDRGFVVLVMNGFVSLDPPTVAEMISALLNDEFRSISGYILCMANPDVWCLSAMAPDLDDDEYATWYSIAEEIRQYLDTPN